ncbi:hypothetical protein AYO43_08245 [Nitrospira sp. SCGC AG-212-E16]|nr:hypothetical protein AYO43_08245 [Nitrospira sp. SCGC AG-212-E16]
MKEWLRAASFGVLVGVLAVVFGCAPMEPVPPPPSTPGSVSTFTSVAGMWAGILKATPRLKQDDWLMVLIHDDGSYQFKSVRTIGIMQGQGRFTLADGKLTVENEHGQIVGTLYEEGGRRMLKLEGATKDGTQYSADLEPKK